MEGYKYGWEALGFKSYKEYLLSPLWKEKVEWVLFIQRRGGGYNSCQRCGKRKYLEVHHLNYYNCCNEGTEDLIILCKECHKKEHGENGTNK